MDPERAAGRASTRDFWIVLGLSLAYGGLTRLVFGLDALSPIYSVVSLTFLFVLPFCFGAVASWIAHRRGRLTLRWALLAPCGVTTLGLVLTFVTELEALVCVVMGAPVFYLLAMAGGATMYYVLRRMHEASAGMLSITLLVPYVLGPVESLLDLPQRVVTVENAIEIEANPEIVWRHIATVETIDRSELPKSWIYLVDFPRPLSATLSRHGVGGIRLATFERGVTFFEVVTAWDPPERLSFEIHADPEFVPATAFDRHIIVGERFFDVLDGTYEIEVLDAGVRLHLSSNHRLSTTFNRYSGWWSERVMRAIQGTILRVIKDRCER